MLSLWDNVSSLWLIRIVFNLEIGMSFLICVSRGRQFPKSEGDIFQHSFCRLTFASITIV